ncbi:30S ribosomal protein S20 [Candidatus Peregrinibacteria bacterium CG10_big_fil_rev_8_21_14_0_10_36_19]|nr:MAG: 30S ribosomal protein S20 [Candidatus Peregrinibacteria bacterium CG10_big_fil_rev_8_21_14_0_10_36_19]
MPVIKSAKKQMKQNAVRRARNFPVRNELKSVLKNELQLIKDGSLEEAKKFLPKVFSIIDMAAKKKIIEKNNASRKKSRISKAINALEMAGKKTEKKAEAAE